MSTTQSLSDVYKATRIIETLRNYTVADNIEQKPQLVSLVSKVYEANSEEMFWNRILKSPDMYNYALFDLGPMKISDWVPRIPGLYWAPDVYERRVAMMKIGGQRDTKFKSQFTLNGLGTNRFPPDSQGNMLISICDHSTNKAIPALLPVSVWCKLGLEPGHIVSVKAARWQPMALEWLQQFDWQAGIPRAYLRIDDESQLTIIKHGFIPNYCPYTIVEYVKGEALVYDYVYHLVFSSPNQVPLTERFEWFRQKYANNGCYLINPDPGSAKPLFDALYSSPGQLRQLESGGRYHIDLISDRIRGAYFGNISVDNILQVLSIAYGDTSAITLVARHLGFPVGTFAGGRAADRIAQLMDWCIKIPGKMEELIDKLVVGQPYLLRK